MGGRGGEEEAEEQIRVQPPKGLSAFEAKAQEQAVASTSQRSVCG